MAGAIPPEVRATWPKPNYSNPESRRGALLGVEIVLLFITVLVMALRMYTRKVIRKSVGLDDWLMTLATISAIALTATNCVSTDFGWGRHVWDFNPIWVVPARKLAFACQLLFVICSSLTKISILTFYLRIFTTRLLRVLAYIGIATVIAWGISFGMVVVLHCIPVEAYWDLRVTEKKCINEVAAHMASASLNTLTDFYIFLLPVHTVWSLKLPIRQRIGLVAIFAIGSIVCIAGVVRIWAIKLVFVDSYDNTWEGAVLYIITAIECDLGILCASIPALKPFFTHYFPGLLSASHSTAGGAGNGLSGNKYQLNELSGNGRKVSIGPGCDRRGRSHFAGNGYGPGITVHVQGGYDFDRESTGSSKVSVADSTAESLAGRGVSNRSEDQIIGGARDGGWDASGRGTKRGSDEHEGPGIAIKKQIQVEVEVTSVSPPTIVEFSPMVLNREQARRERERKP